MRSGRTSRPPLVAAVAALASLAAFAVPQLPGFARAETGSSSSPSTAPSTTPSSTSAKDQKKAADLFKKSVDAYRKGDFQTTVDLLTQAYALDPQPVLLYNLARAEEGLGNTDAAIDAYDRFLQQEPKAADRGAIEQRLATLRRQRDERLAAQKQHEADQHDAATKPPAREAPPATPSRPVETSKPSLVPIVVAGVGLASIGAGVVTGLMAKSGESDAQGEPVQQRAIEQRDSAETLATISTITFIAGGILFAGGVGWFVIDRQSKKTGSRAPSSPQVAIGPGFIGLHGALP